MKTFALESLSALLALACAAAVFLAAALESPDLPAAAVAPALKAR